MADRWIRAQLQEQFREREGDAGGGRPPGPERNGIAKKKRYAYRWPSMMARVSAGIHIRIEGKPVKSGPRDSYGEPNEASGSPRSGKAEKVRTEGCKARPKRREDTAEIVPG